MSAEPIDAKISPVLIVEEYPQEKESDVAEQIKDVLKEMKSNEQSADDGSSIQSYDVNDINVDCGWKDICGAPVPGYESDDGIQYGYFPGSFDDSKNINVMTPMLSRILDSHIVGNEKIRTYAVDASTAYTILSTPKQKLIRIQNKILPLDDFLQFCYFEQIGTGVECKTGSLIERTHVFLDTNVDTIVAIYMHALYNLQTK
jgi:hypothetical protein